MFLSFILQYLRYERRRFVKCGVSVFVLYNACTTEYVKQLIGLSAKLAVLSDLVSGYGESFCRTFVMEIDILRDVKMWEWKDL